MAEALIDIHRLFLRKLLERHKLRPVALKHQFPERPLRALGLLKIDGAVYESDAFLRVMALTTKFPGSSRCTRSLFLGPRPERYLPIFSSETILMGAKRAFLVDIHTTIRPERWHSLRVEPRMMEIKNRYPDLCAQPLAMRGRINDIMSPAHLYVRVPPERDGCAIELFTAYLDLYLDLVEHTPPCAAEKIPEAVEDFERYRDTVMNHDPAVKLYSLLFGKKGGTERVDALFFAR